MNGQELVEAVRYLLEVRQEGLLKKTNRMDLADELEEIEAMIELAQEGWVE